MKYDRELWEPVIERRVRELLALGASYAVCARLIVEEVRSGELSPDSAHFAETVEDVLDAINAGGAQ